MNTAPKQARRYALLVVLLAWAMGTSAAPVMAMKAAPTPAPAMSPSEAAFVHSVTADLQKRFGTPAQAAAAGYFQYTNEDETGAISWVNTKYWKSDPQHPSQLWYDAKGHLIGVDLSVPKDGLAKPPHLWGVSPSRWFLFDQHVHYGIKTESGILFGAVGPKAIRRVGGSPSHPTAEDIVKLGKAKSPAEVAFVFEFPEVWDLEFWLVPNPLGPFAEFNPNVHPTATARSSM
jgi:hypothetical protein